MTILIILIHVMLIMIGRGQMGSALMGSLHISCSSTEGLFGHSGWPTFILPKVPGRTFLPNSSKSLSFCSGTISVDPICPQPNTILYYGTLYYNTYNYHYYYYYYTISLKDAYITEEKHPDHRLAGPGPRHLPPRGGHQGENVITSIYLSIYLSLSLYIYIYIHIHTTCLTLLI